MKRRDTAWLYGWAAVVSVACQLPPNALGGDAGAGNPAPSTPETFGPVVLWANGLHGSCRGTESNMQAAITVEGNTQPLYGPGQAAFLDPGQQTLQLGSGLAGCRDDYASLQLNAQNNHVYLLTAWGDPTNFTETTALVDITSELIGDQGGAVLVNLSTLVPSVEFAWGAGDAHVVLTPGYLVVPGAIRQAIVAAPEAEPATVGAPPASSHYWLVLYRDNSDGTAAELARPAGVPTPP